MAYTIHNDEWFYTGFEYIYTDDTNNFQVILRFEDHRYEETGYKLLGTCILPDDSSVYYYDLLQPRLTLRPYCSELPLSEIMDDNGFTPIELPEWFITEMEYRTSVFDERLFSFQEFAQEMDGKEFSDYDSMVQEFTEWAKANYSGFDSEDIETALWIADYYGEIEENPNHTIYIYD